MYNKSMIRLVSWNYTKKDLEDLYAHTDQSHCLVALPIPLPEQKTEQYMQALQAGTVNGKTFLCFGILSDDTLIGKIDLFRSDDMSAELDIVIRREYTGQGNGTEALRQLLYRLNVTGWCFSIHAYTDSENIPAGKAFRKAGFHPSRRFKADVVTEHEGIYKMKNVLGIEYSYILENLPQEYRHSA